jgi:hypothetical protein
MSALLPHIGTASVCLAALAFLLGAIVERGAQLQTHLQRAAAAGAVPSGLVLVYGAIDPSILSQVPGLNIPILFGGLSLLYVSLKAATQKSN